MTISVQTSLIKQIAALDNGKLVSQGEKDEFYVSRGVKEHFDDSLKRILSYFDSENNDEVHDLITNRNRVYFDVGKWSDYVRSLDFMVGLRLHGNIIALQQGVPSVFITYDSRIREISELMHLPFLDVSNSSTIQWDLRELYNQADFSKFEQIYLDRYYNYVQFLETNDVLHNLVSNAMPSIGGQMQKDKIAA